MKRNYFVSVDYANGGWAVGNVECITVEEAIAVVTYDRHIYAGDHVKVYERNPYTLELVELVFERK